MAQKILSAKQKQIMAEERRLVVLGGRGEGEGWTGHSGFWDMNCYIWNGWEVNGVLLHSTGNCV